MKNHLGLLLAGTCMALAAGCGASEEVLLEGPATTRASASVEDAAFTTLDYPGCEQDYSDHNTPVLYEGITTERKACSGETSTVFVNFLHEVPAGITLDLFQANSFGKFGLDDKLAQRAPLHLVKLDTFVNPWGVPITRYRISISYTLVESEYCRHATFSAAYQLATHCPELPTIRSPPQTDSLTPKTYAVYPFIVSSASNAGAHKFVAIPSVTSCSECHKPALGPTPEHVFEYRRTGTTPWSTITRGDYLAFEVTVASAGVYEFRSKGRLKPNGSYSSYSPVSVLYVP
ncbi:MULTISPECIES: hypothetical protein [unclassified Myxococcus]|uniref:hypothetical protein n=1 Tax=unclassified Myxococcus TaxID=2648731 RepID=UPI00157B0003|nr:MULTISPECIES: hypothetical protein [unclassified Myxococcus]NTX39807.1 hypothetical protein [Myxococcus sp. CA033]NTX52900.1 hypothetical protein [Myxococcus sp. CA039A]